jgi:hypothetical protein
MRQQDMPNGQPRKPRESPMRLQVIYGCTGTLTTLEPFNGMPCTFAKLLLHGLLCSNHSVGICRGRKIRQSLRLCAAAVDNGRAAVYLVA